MKLGALRFAVNPRRRVAVAAAVACVAIGVPVGAAAASAPHASAPHASAPHASAPHASAVAQCNNNDTYAWFADAANGTAGYIYYPVEFTNTGSSSCTLSGYPGFSAVNGKLKQLGPAAKRSGAKPATVTLKPGQTASAMVGILPPGFVTGCKKATAAGFRIYAPNETNGQLALNLSFSVCTNKRTLTIGAVTKGIGVS
jgi:hypothetical protein